MCCRTYLNTALPHTVRKCFRLHKVSFFMLTLSDRTAIETVRFSEMKKVKIKHATYCLSYSSASNSVF